MNDIIISILVGGFTGVGVVTYLSKRLVENQLNKTLKKYQHELDIKKDTLATELSLYVNHQTLKLTNFEEAKRNAIHNIYNAVIMTSSSRVGFKKSQGLDKCQNSNDFGACYFQSFSENFQAFSTAFQAISNAYSVLEKESIYIDDALEEEVRLCLKVIHKTYIDNHDSLNIGHDKAKLLSNQQNLTFKTMPFDIDNFYDQSTREWSHKTSAARHRLKATMRELLSI
ncbi:MULTISPECIES: hypothetical protein [Vibrio]|uniref:hypothetical protein n=1 Tax=Vibrio TaxID=662 RepID=UPI001A8DA69B|nr:MULTISPECIES: hypothetical protein [Vibrio]ELA7385307.1 hypothetical protein [Vibrio alginolyticus]MBO0243252.1 hypothetical protein [Vibrio sp. Vb0592]MBS9910085.1 hypothetical protein [Vibrio alginolyticus]MBT0047664.1 hypothetical protein [Vibrio alginolyticus]MBT0061624.1 hypothetical protein [Vibrio alginolyticus]